MTTESINAVKSKIKNLREWVTPARTTSAFLSKGVLTPEEFVKAGTDYIYIYISNNNFAFHRVRSERKNIIFIVIFVNSYSRR